MELSWLMRLRIAAVVATGMALIGILAWPLAAPPDPLGSVQVSNINLIGATALVLLAFGVGFISYFISWPYGREIGILAVPSGLAVWTVRSGSMAQLIQLNPTLPQRQTLFAALKWEPFFWLLIVAAGFAGVLLGQKIRSRPELAGTPTKANPKPNTYLNAIIALVGSGLIAQFCINILAQDVMTSDNKLATQPAVGQIVFSVLVSFGLAAFLVKKFLNMSYIWSTMASAFVTTFAIATYAKQDMLQHFVGRYPATFFANAVISILPVQMVALGTLGSIAGYWLAVRYSYRRKHANK
ncbi:MAG: hypothetical protein ACE5NM_11395 [Sedimentisphaerales bacterium]